MKTKTIKPVFMIALCVASALSSACRKLPLGVTVPEGSESLEATAVPMSSTAPLNLDPNRDEVQISQNPVPGSTNEPLTTEKTDLVRATICYVTDDGYILPVEENIAREDGIARACLMKLVSGGENGDILNQKALNAPIPAGTTIGISISNGDARVDLNGMAPLASAEAEKAMYTAIVNTLTAFRSIDTVSIYLNGRNDMTANGTKPPEKQGQLPINIEDTALAASGNAKTSVLYFPSLSGSVLIPTTRYSDGGASLYGTITALAQGTKLKGLRSCFPENTLILGATIENGILSVNCSSDFSKITETQGLYELAMQSVLLTARPFGSIDEIHFLINGVQFEPEA